MKNSFDKWKLGVLKVQKKESSPLLSTIANGGETTATGVLDETKDMEVSCYKLFILQLSNFCNKLNFVLKHNIGLVLYISLM